MREDRKRRRERRRRRWGWMQREEWKGEEGEEGRMQRVGR